MEGIDWSDCPVVEVVPERMHGVPVVKGTRVAAVTIIECAELGESAEEIAEDYRIEVGSVNALLAYAVGRFDPAPAR